MKMNEIEDSYVKRGYRGPRLKRALEKDKRYKTLLNRRKSKFSIGTRITKAEKARYVLSVEDDINILNICKNLENLPLSTQDKQTVKLIKSQLEHDWRRPLVSELKRLERKYRK